MTGREEAPATRRVKLTYDDFVEFPDDGMRHELIEGEHYVSPAPSRRHQALLGRLHLDLGNWVEAHPIGQVLLSPFDVVFTPFDVVEPDLLYISNRRVPESLNDKNATGIDLAVEIGSPGTRRRDETVKLRLYERAGVAEYWFVEPHAGVVRAYRRADDLFAAPIEFSAARAETLTTDLLPGFELSLARVFREGLPER